MQISINLLPQEIKAEEIKRTKFVKVQAFGVATVLVFIFLASLMLALRILQNQNIKQIQANLSSTEQLIADLAGRQASLFIIKDRLTTIEKYFGVSSKQVTVLRLISGLLPAQVTLNSMTVDRSGEVLIVAVLPEADVLDNLITSLTSKEKNEDKISQVSMDSINRGRDGVYRVSFKVKPKL